MSNKIETVSIGDLPSATELDDADELLLRDASATLPENATARLSIATLRAAMGSPDRIESASGDAFSEATDSFRGLGTPATQSEAIARGAGASSGAYTLPKGADKAVAEAALFAGTAAMTNGASIKARYDSETGERRLVAEGAPLEVPTPTAPNHAATKGYVDARPGADAWSERPATQDVDLDGHKITGLGEPTGAADAATKGYVDARPGADAWSEHPATQDVDLDGHKITGLGAPTDASDAATKGYVDDALDEYEPPAPTRLEWDFSSVGKSVIEADPNGGIHIWRAPLGNMHDIGQRRVEIKFPTSVSGDTAPMVIRNRAQGADPFGSELILDTSNSIRRWKLGSTSNSGTSEGYMEMFQGIIRVSARGGAPIPLMDNAKLMLPSGVNSFMHGIHLAKEAHDQRALVEWWEPVWTPVENVDSVSNVECSYTRTYRAAGGSLVTLEGTIEVESLGAGQCGVTVPVPVPVAGSPIVMGVAAMHKDAETSQATAILMSGALQIGFDADDVHGHTVAFRISYRAA